MPWGPHGIRLSCRGPQCETEPRWRLGGARFGAWSRGVLPAGPRSCAVASQQCCDNNAGTGRADNDSRGGESSTQRCQGRDPLASTRALPHPGDVQSGSASASGLGRRRGRSGRRRPQRGRSRADGSGARTSREQSSATRWTPDNGWFSATDANVLHSFLAATRPGRIGEVGSGYSTAVMLDAADSAGTTKNVTCIEPYPTGSDRSCGRTTGPGDPVSRPRCRPGLVHVVDCR